MCDSVHAAIMSRLCIDAVSGFGQARTMSIYIDSKHTLTNALGASMASSISELFKHARVCTVDPLRKMHLAESFPFQKGGPLSVTTPIFGAKSIT